MAFHNLAKLGRYVQIVQVYTVSSVSQTILKSFYLLQPDSLATHNVWLIFMRNTVNVIISCSLAITPHE